MFVVSACYNVVLGLLYLSIQHHSDSFFYSLYSWFTSLFQVKWSRGFFFLVLQTKSGGILWCLSGETYFLHEIRCRFVFSLHFCKAKLTLGTQCCNLKWHYFIDIKKKQKKDQSFFFVFVYNLYSICDFAIIITTTKSPCVLTSY